MNSSDAPSLRESQALPLYVRKVLGNITRTQRRYVLDGCIHGGCSMRTVRALRAAGLFYLKIDSPNGQCGHMVLTPLGKTVQALIRQGSRKDGSSPKNTTSD
jgi:hypothetical protein